MGSAYLHWVVQRDAHTGALITFRSFADYTGAEMHKAKLEELSGHQEKNVAVTIETLPVEEQPRSFCRVIKKD
jgi:hypothetical protein